MKFLLVADLHTENNNDGCMVSASLRDSLFSLAIKLQRNQLASRVRSRSLIYSSCETCMSACYKGLWGAHKEVTNVMPKGVLYFLTCHIHRFDEMGVVFSAPVNALKYSKAYGRDWVLE